MLRTMQTGHLPLVRLSLVRCMACYSSRFSYKRSGMPPHRGETYYQVLNVPICSSDKQIKSAFIELSKKYHPDANTKTRDSEVFMKICEAYQTLHRQNSRQIYDSSLRMQHTTRSPSETAFTSRQFSTAWSQYQSSMRSKQKGRCSQRFTAAKPSVFNPKADSQYLPMRISIVDLQKPLKLTFEEANEDGDGEGYGYDKSWEYYFPHGPIYYLYLAGLCGVGGLVLMDLLTRFRKNRCQRKVQSAQVILDGAKELGAKA